MSLSVPSTTVARDHAPATFFIDHSLLGQTPEPPPPTRWQRAQDMFCGCFKPKNESVIYIAAPRTMAPPNG